MDTEELPQSENDAQPAIDPPGFLAELEAAVHELVGKAYDVMAGVALSD